MLKKLAQTEIDLFKILCEPAVGKLKVKVPWSQELIPAIASLWGLDSHEILHTGWNLALMDLLDIERFPDLKKVWG